MPRSVRSRRVHEDFVTKTIEIPAPVADLGEQVLVLNYRKRPPRWEEGVVKALKYENRWGEFSWHYEVWVIRGRARKPLRLYVDNEGIQKNW